MGAKGDRAGSPSALEECGAETDMRQPVGATVRRIWQCSFFLHTRGAAAVNAWQAGVESEMTRTRVTTALASL